MIYTISKISDFIYHQSYSLLQKDIETRGYGLMYLFGPSCVGKTKIRQQLFYKMNTFKPLCIKSGYWLKPRKERFKHKLGENEREAYNYSKMINDIRHLFKYRNLTVHKYLHKSGRHSIISHNISLPKLIQIEGTIWKDFIKSLHASFIVYIEPSNFLDWEVEQVHRNITERGYRIEEAIKLYNASMRSWSLNRTIDFENLGSKLIALQAIFDTKSHKVFFKIKREN